MAKLFSVGCGPLLPVLLFLLLASVPIMALEFGPVEDLVGWGEKLGEKISPHVWRKMDLPEGFIKGWNRGVKACKIVKKSQEWQQKFGGGTTTYTIVFLGVHPTDGTRLTVYTADITATDAARLDLCGLDVQVALARVQPSSSFPLYGSPGTQSLTPRPLPRTVRVYP